MATRVTSVLPPLLALLLAVFVVAPVDAQRVLVGRSVPGSPPTTDLIDLATGVKTAVSNDLTDSAVFLSDGTVLIRRVAGEHWRVRFMASGLELPLPQGFAPDPFGLASVVVPHPRALAAFGLFRDPLGRNGVSRIDWSGLHLVAPCGSDQSVNSFDITPNGDELFVPCDAQAADQALIVIDSATGQERRRVPLGSARASQVVVVAGAREFLYTAGPIGRWLRPGSRRRRHRGSAAVCPGVRTVPSDGESSAS